MPIRTAASLTLLLPLLLPAFAVACLAVCYLSGHPLRAGLLNADALYLPTLFDDLLTRGGRLSDWYLTPAPYFFPDYPLYLAAWWMAPTSYYQIIVFGVLQCALLSGAVALLARALGARAVLPAAACSLTLFAWLAASGREPFVLLLSNAYHFGGFLAAVLLAAALLRFEASASRAALGAACLLAFVGTLSDSLFLLQAALPLAGAASARILLERGKPGRRQRLLVAWTPVMSALLGHVGYRLLVAHPTRYDVHLDPGRLAANLHDLAGIGLDLWQALPLAVLGWLACAAFALACAVRLARRRDPFGLPPALAWLLVFWLVSATATLAVSLPLAPLPVAARYFIPAACWPILLAPMVAAHLLPARRAPALLLAGACAFTLGIGMATARQWQAHPIETAYYPADNACLDRALARMDLHHGVAQYWDAKPFQRFSRSGIVLAQHIASLEELPWITSERYFRPAYDFALVGPDAPPPHHIPAARLEAINGPPLARVRCGAYTILLYGRGGMRVY
ncbi:hypothetical protein [Herbaspirillum sp. SJZ107]|uniref:hypothetical protein n=1 Tax=Herbaspirillum sp. SJZ107 TaxID=2572881 RepID=UPI001151DB4A|nr:hypothetical protein [Herbaspirillum sp. SJZ107]TQK02543.1 hypothetical protein FBX97_5193 [Herbaspirillum sp. SJZ107]